MEPESLGAKTLFSGCIAAHDTSDESCTGNKAGS